MIKVSIHDIVVGDIVPLNIGDQVSALGASMASFIYEPYFLLNVVSGFFRFLLMES